MDIRNNEKNLPFEYEENGEIARLEYRFFKKNRAMMHTVVPVALQGKGIASTLAAEAFFLKSKKTYGNTAIK